MRTFMRAGVKHSVDLTEVEWMCEAEGNVARLRLKSGYLVDFPLKSLVPEESRNMGYEVDFDAFVKIVEDIKASR